MPAGFAGSVAATATSGAGVNLTATAGDTTTEGNLLVALSARTGATVDATSIADSKSNTWTKAFEVAKATTGPQVAGFWCVIGVGKSHVSGVDTFTTSWATPTSRCLLVAEFTGLVAAPFDQVAWATGDVSTSLASSSTGTTTQADELLVGGFGALFAAAGHVFTEGSGYTIANSRTNVAIEAMLEYRVVSATGAYSASCTVDAAPNGWVAGILTFKAAAGGTPSGHLLASAGVGL